MADSNKQEKPPGYNPAFGTQRGFKWKVQMRLFCVSIVGQVCLCMWKSAEN